MIFILIAFVTCISGQHAVAIPPPTVVTPVLASVGFSSTPPIQQIPIANSQEVLRKAQEEAKVITVFVAN